MKIIQGDVTAPGPEGTRIIAHICNNVRQWHDPVAQAISERWPEPEASFYRHANLLGTIKVVTVDESLLVANLFGQDGEDPGRLPMEAAEYCFRTLAHFARMYDASVHLARSPGILARQWDNVSEVIDQTFAGVDLYIYDL